MLTGAGRGIALLGELSKIVTVSSARFGGSPVTAHANGSLGLKLRGAPGEEVTVSYLVYAHRGDVVGEFRQDTFSLGADGVLAATVGPVATDPLPVELSQPQAAREY